MPYKNNGGPWGGGGGDDKKGSGDRGPWGGNRPGAPPVPDIDRIVRKGQEQLRVLMGGRGGGVGRPGGPSGEIGRAGWALIGLAIVGGWLFMSLYTVKPEERSVEFIFGEYHATRDPGLNFAPWPVITYEKAAVTRENTVNIGRDDDRRSNRAPEGLMLTGDENIVDIDFQVVWNIVDLPRFLFNLREPDLTIKSVSESAMREVIGRSELKPILNRDRASVSQEVGALIQSTLDSYNAGVRIVRLNFDKADPPSEVIDAFRDVQAAAQDRDRTEKEAETYANQKLAGARGESAQLLQEAEAYRAQVVNEAEGEASRFKAIYTEYSRAKDVTRKRLYLETMERVLAGVNKVVVDQNAGNGAAGGVVPYLPLPELRRAEVN